MQDYSLQDLTRVGFIKYEITMEFTYVRRWKNNFYLLEILS
ncbi:hypothetical protein HMPREF0072_2205 [Anaerococcus lactolyticus ATCC 51172]|uniref:Uncharacterized protein n=1 Tax=Anaerococcus lactolyticus ATCC 51172 TaxID=525254 RepID=C2BIN5_9FIRM|nr:hypothetical protein HMPREF0072_2205 [Anaerococcus lactolyticus ATCC 51172]